MEQLLVKELIEATGGRLLQGDPAVRIRHVETDSRKTKEGDVFFALIGERFDAHDFLDSALEGGADGCVISREPRQLLPGKYYVLVPDTIRAMGDLARYYKRKFQIPTVAVTGSVGKTTTKDMIAAVLSAGFNVLKTEGNFNNNIGLPMTIFRLGPEHQIAVLEMGMNHKDEIDYLTRIGEPDIAVITNIGDAHIGNLGSREGIFQAKCEIFHGLREGGIAVLNGDDDLLTTLRGKTTFEIRWIGESAACDYRAEDVDGSRTGMTCLRAVTPEGSFDLEVPAPGHHMLYSVMTAAAIALYFGMTEEQIRAGLASYVPTAMRMNIDRLPGGVVLYNDTYNANTASMKAGLDILSGTAAALKIAVLGDMLEQGTHEEDLHRQVGAYAAESAADILIAVGRASEKMAEEASARGMRDVRWCPDHESAMAELEQLAGGDRAFLFKASRGMHLEKLYAYTKALLEGADS